MKLLATASCILLLSAAAFAAPFELESQEGVQPRADPPNYRLGTDVLPLHYNITLKPYLRSEDGAKRFTFDGELQLILQTNKTGVTEITLHAKRLNFTRIEYHETSNPTTLKEIEATSLDTVTDKFTMTVPAALKSGVQYTFHFIYRGHMDDDMHGFYRSNYVDENGNEKWLGSTQFQTYHARRAFPCFDEPKFKAVYQVHINRHKTFNVVSNTHSLGKIESEPEHFIETFKETPKMSTYLLAFLVSEFTRNGDDDFYVVARPEFYGQTAFAYEVGPKLLQGFDNFTTLPYYTLGNDKMSMAAIPDFSAGAMENWGLLTYRERALLFKNGSSTLSSKQSIASIIAHEQAHMWFGDLVTCDWWSWTWLNEGFARYFQYFMTHEVHPEFQMDLQFTVDQIQSVFGMDSTNNTNPMSDLNTNSPADVSRMFNSISYNKGASVIRMIRHAMGEDNFKASLRAYLNERKNTNTVPADLFKHWKNHFPKENHVDTDALFTGWTDQVGYPVITVNVSSDGLKAEISQKRFLLKNDSSDDTLLYTVPITYTTNKENDFEDTKPRFFLNATEAASEMIFKEKINWIVVNIQQTGYYRVNYDTKSWHGIHHALLSQNWGGIHPLNRAQVVDDLLNLARAGVIDYDLCMNVLEYLKTELHYAPWTAAFNGFSTLAIRLGTDNRNFGRFMLQNVEKVYNHLGFEENANDTALDIYNRNKVLSWSCKYGNKDCVTKAKNLYKNLITKQTPVPVNIRSAVYCTAMREGSESDFDALVHKFQTENVATEQSLLINVLGCVKAPKLVEKYFGYILNDTIRKQDKSAALSALYSENAENVSPVFKLVTDNYKQLGEAMGDLSDVATVISNIASRFTTVEQKKSLEEFNDKNKGEFGSSARTLERAVQTVEENLEWSERRLPKFKDYLAQRAGAAAAIPISFGIVLMVAIASFLLN